MSPAFVIRGRDFWGGVFNDGKAVLLAISSQESFTRMAYR